MSERKASNSYKQPAQCNPIAVFRAKVGLLGGQGERASGRAAVCGCRSVKVEPNTWHLTDLPRQYPKPTSQAALLPPHVPEMPHGDKTRVAGLCDLRHPGPTVRPVLWWGECGGRGAFVARARLGSGSKGLEAAPFTQSQRQDAFGLPPHTMLPSPCAVSLQRSIRWPASQLYMIPIYSRWCNHFCKLDERWEVNIYYCIRPPYAFPYHTLPACLHKPKEHKVPDFNAD